MNTHAHNGHAANGKAVDHTISRAATQAARRGKKAKRAVAKHATAIVKRSDTTIVRTANGMVGWVKKNPALSIGALLGGGLVVGALASSRFRKLAMLGVAGAAALVADRF